MSIIFKLTNIKSDEYHFQVNKQRAMSIIFKLTNIKSDEYHFQVNKHKER